VLPVGNAGNITAYWKGYQEYRAANQSTRLPRMVGFQAAGAAPIVLGRIVENPQTVASAIRIGNPASWEAALNAVKESAGAIDSVTDEEILQAYRAVAATEGVFCEPASAASVAGVMKLSKQGGLREGETVVCTLTGHGLKDADTAISVSAQPKTVRATREDVARLLRV
jgi:threonine synthase